jgi:hypothetical protein
VVLLVEVPIGQRLGHSVKGGGAVKRQEAFELAHALGHTDPALFETPGGRWYVTCSCGYKSTTRNTEVDALSAGVHHALTVAKNHVREIHSNGLVGNPRIVGGKR